MNILIVDDEALARSRLRTLLSDCADSVAMLMRGEAEILITYDTPQSPCNVPEQLARRHVLGHLRQGVEVGVVAGAVGQGHVEVGGGLDGRVVAGGVHREGEDGLVSGADFGGAVALVHVQVHHQHAARQPVRLHVAGRHRGVVEHAVAAAARRPGK